MKLYKVWIENPDYEEYDSMIVAAESEEEAKNIHPDETWVPPGPPYVEVPIKVEDWPKLWTKAWAEHPSLVLSEYLGEAKPGTKRGIICSSFNAS